ncbi:alcohol dehydrogenase [Novosphingobium fuchskuhlense]|uniref:Alcohol dehydrogenase n=1 Tax=Novosphingobium fuchskuhlense TaxID=1117702 RepID=A0A124JW67_9SPHN|nr:PQQ-dependent dehydrogenase, methanol/ethanol family [Novosphingobium fuchskuhlense]KUR73007.1 alcohol dehydrogenase [Novosphingobium fuchskuhlense]
MRVSFVRKLAMASVLALSVGAVAQSGAMAGVTEAMLRNVPAGEWLSYGRDYAEQRYSPLTLINEYNVDQLGLAWSADLDTARGQEATPLVHDGVLYVSTAWSMVKAYDAKTGKPLWAFDPKVPRETLVRTCCDAVNRGVALYGDKVFVAALDGRLIALDQKTGKVLWSKVTVPNQTDYTITGAPRIVKGRVLIGAAGSEYKARGYLSAYDPETGKEVWRFNTVPGNPGNGFGVEGVNKDAHAAAAKTWGNKWWELGGGGTVWDSITYDPETNLVLFGTGNAEPWNPAANGRDGDSLYTSSIVAVNADTGQYAWHFQETPEDRWDFDSDQQITIGDVVINGEKRHVAMHAPKNGHVYVLDVKTGKFLSATPWVPVNWATAIDPQTGRPTINPAAQYEKTGKPFVSLPGAVGAHSWQPQSYSPKTGYLYIPTNLAAFPYMAAAGWKPTQIGFQTGLDSYTVAMPADAKVQAGAKAATTGQLVAWDVANKKPAWKVDLVGPSNGGVLSTAGNLVFQGTAAGEFVAYTADKGQKLWSFPAQTGIIAAPMTYAVDGEQYVAILAGWGGVWDIATGVLANKAGAARNISRLLVFKLGAKGELPAPPPMNQMVLDPPPFTGTTAQATHGGQLYGRYCAVCHGDAAVAGGLNPDLRHSAIIGSAEALKAIVIGGQLHELGMVSFKSALKAPDAEAIRMYLVKRANEDKALASR